MTMEIPILQLGPIITHNWLFLWDDTLYKLFFFFFFVVITGKTGAMTAYLLRLLRSAHGPRSPDQSPQPHSPSISMDPLKGQGRPPVLPKNHFLNMYGWIHRK